MTERISAKKIVRLYLKERGYDGLCKECCGCSLDDLYSCADCANECEAAYRYAFVQDSPHNCPEYEECSKSETECVSKMYEIAGFDENELFFAEFKKDCRCRRPYANQEAGALP
jgi:hypothetical protein